MEADIVQAAHRVLPAVEEDTVQAVHHVLPAEEDIAQAQAAGIR